MREVAKEANYLSGWGGLFSVMVLWMMLVLVPGDHNGVVRIAGNGMLPQLLPGDLLLMKPLGDIPAHGDIVTFLPTREQAAIDNLGTGLQVSRVVGIPGDRLQKTGKGYLLNASDRIESMFARDWLDFGQVLTLPPGKYFLLNSGDPAKLREGERGSASIGLVDVDQIRVMQKHVPGHDILNAAAPAVLVGALMIVTIGWFFWFCGRYCRPSLPLKVILALSWTVLFLMAASVLVLRVTGRADHSPLVFGAYFYYRYFRWLGDGALAHLAAVGGMCALMVAATWWAARRGVPEPASAALEGTGASTLPRVWPLGFGVLAISLAAFSRASGTGSGLWGVVAAVAGAAVLAALWQIEVAAFGSETRKRVVWSARALRCLRLVIGLLGAVALLVMVEDWLQGRGKLLDPAQPDAFFVILFAAAFLVGYGLPGVRRSSLLSAARHALLKPAKLSRLLILFALLAGAAFYAYQRQMPSASRAQLLQAAGARFSFAKASVEEFFQNEGRLPDELDTSAIFGNAPHTRGLTFVGPGVLRLAVESGTKTGFHAFMLFEPDASKPFGITYRCVYDDPGLREENARLLGCTHEQGLNVRSFASRRSLAAKTPRAADGPLAETHIYFRLHGSDRADMGPASLPPPARKNDEVVRYAQMLEANLRETVFVAGGDPREIEVVGYADATGPEESNQALSEARAEAVKAYLVELGVPVSAISIRGAGQEPMPQECSPGRPHVAECLYRSRRVEVRIWK